MIGYHVRLAEPHDVGILVALCAEHAAFERAYFEIEGLSERLVRALFGENPRARAWVADLGDAIVGYATVSEEFSTWSATSYLHMDCLFVRPGLRNAGIGAALLRAVVQEARSRGLSDVQWQTPDWNADARRFYLRQGATASGKIRFSLSAG